MILPGWRKVVCKAWSIRLAAAAALFSGIEVIMPFLETAMLVPRGVFAALSGGVTIAAVAARIMVQAELSGGEK